MASRASVSFTLGGAASPPAWPCGRSKRHFPLLALPPTLTAAARAADRVAAVVAAAAADLAAVAAADRAAVGSGGSSGGSSGGGSSSGGGASGGSSGGSSSGADAGGACPQNKCATGSCCANTATGVTDCSASCASNDVIQCTQPSDCVGGAGADCCATAVIIDSADGGTNLPNCGLMSVTTSCGTCATNINFLPGLCTQTATLHVCTTSADCASDTANTDCCQIQSYHVCVPSGVAMIGKLTCN